jgi:hypothetical protein
MKANKNVWLYNLYDSPMNDEGWLWNWQDLLGNSGSIYKAMNKAKQTEQIGMNQNNFIRLVCAYLYDCYETGSKPSAREIMTPLRAEFKSFKEFKIESIRDFYYLKILPRIRTTLKTKDYQIFATWLKETT